MVSLLPLQMPCKSARRSHQTKLLMCVARPCCIGIKGGKIHTLSPSFSSDEIEGAQVIDAE